MPVWRKPMVVSAPTTYSPDSSSTRRSTPCVLGCWGPMLTVIVSERSSGLVLVVIGVPGHCASRLHKEREDRRSGGNQVGLLTSCPPVSFPGRLSPEGMPRLSQLTLHELADRVNQRAVRFLDPRRARV